MKLDDLSGSGLIAFSDPAGAKAALSVASLRLHDDPTASIQLCANRSYPFFSEWPHEVVVAPAACNITWPSDPLRWVFTGTSHPDSGKGFELEIIELARNRAIPSIAFIDHYTNYQRRFLRGTELILPDFIWVLDIKARDEAIADGLPEDRLVIQPNPYLIYIGRLWYPHTSRAEIISSVRAPEESQAFKRIWLYVPDPISLRNTGEWSFDELTTLCELLVALDQAADTLLWVRPHPLQPMDKMEKIIAEYRPGNGNTIACRSDFAGLDLASAADAIVGFHSNFLLEANAVGKKVLRYFPSNRERDAFAHLNIGTVVSSSDSLHAFLLSNHPAS